MKFGPYNFSDDAFPTIAGPCVIESERLLLKMARLLAVRKTGLEARRHE